MSLSSMLLLSNAVFFVFSALAVIASITVFLLTRASEREKDRELDRYKVEASSKIAAAHEASQLAIRQAAEANARAEEAQLHRMKLEQRLAHRKISVSSREKLIEKFSSIAILPVSGEQQNIAIYSTIDGLEPNSFADQLAGLFFASGWGINRNTVHYGQPQAVLGVAVFSLGKNWQGASTAHIVAADLASEGFQATTGAFYDWSNEDPSMVDQFHTSITLMVGDRM